MASSPESQAEGPLRVSVVGQSGSSLDVNIHSVTVRCALNRIPWAEIVLLDGDMTDGSFDASDAKDFAPGETLTIRAGYGDRESTLFTGVVIRHGVRIDGGDHSMLVLECRSKVAAMAIGRRNANYLNQKDSDIISGLVSDAGLTPKVDSTADVYTELVQYYCSDWDFMLARAELNGLLVNVTGNTVSVAAPSVSGDPVLAVGWGTDLYAFDADMDVRTQFTAVQATAWSAKNQAVVTGDAAKPVALNSQGDLDGKTLANVTGSSTVGLQTATAQEKGVLTAWAKAMQQKAALARIRGSMRFVGNAAAVPGCQIKVSGVGKHFSGNVFVSAVEHQIADGLWVTEACFGMDPAWHMARDDVMAPAAAGLLPGVAGLQIGVVIKLDGDPDSEQRIQVRLPVMQAETEGVWARLLQGYASNGFGLFFLPEVGDEVIVAYLNDDPSQPVVLGSLYSSSRVPPYALAAENDTKALVTREKLTIELDEKKKVVTIKTPAGNQVVLDDTGKSILVKDQNSNSATFSSSGITLDSPYDINLKAKGNIKLEASASATVKASADVKISGLNVTCEAQAGLTAKGSATAELSASGQTTVKGAMVMIN